MTRRPGAPGPIASPCSPQPRPWSPATVGDKAPPVPAPAPAADHPDDDEPADPGPQARARWIAEQLARAPEPTQLMIAIIVSTLAPTDPPEHADPDGEGPTAA